LAKIESAVAVQTKGLAVALELRTKASVFCTGSLTLRKVPRRMACWVMRLNQISTWFSQEA